MYRRFGSRRAVGSQVKGTSAPADPLVAILGSNLIDYWNAGDAVLSGSDVVSITGRVFGLALTGVSAPQYSASDATLNSAPSVRTNGVAYVKNTSVPGVFCPSGNRPFLWVIGYTNNIPGGGFVVTANLVSAGWDASTRMLFVSAFDIPWVSNLSGDESTGSSADDNFGVPFVNGTLIRAGVGDSFWQNNVESTPNAAGAAALGSALSGLAIGANTNGSSAAEITFALAGVCKNAPTAGELSGLYAYAQSNYGVP